tara:strand:- start:805 stop:945 length:141 start_codon:yes stop_codon:yes gene_type:complete
VLLEVLVVPAFLEEHRVVESVGAEGEQEEIRDWAVVVVVAVVVGWD